MKKGIFTLVMVTALALSMTGCKSTDYKDAVALEEQGDYSGALELFNGIADYKDSADHITYCTDMNEAITAYNSAKDKLEGLNSELQTKLDDAKALISSGTPLDDTLITTLETRISEAKAAKVELIDMLETADEINKAAETMEAADYTEALANLETAYDDLDVSIQQYALVDNPTEEFIIERLGNVEFVQDISAVDEETDPYGKLNKSKSYTAIVFFSSSQINQSSVYGTTLIDKGTDAGGCIEVFTTPEDANTRNDYLGAFDGTWFDPGKHVVIGTCVVRCGSTLTASKQEELETAVIEALTAL